MHKTEVISFIRLYPFVYKNNIKCSLLAFTYSTISRFPKSVTVEVFRENLHVAHEWFLISSCKVAPLSSPLTMILTYSA